MNCVRLWAFAGVLNVRCWGFLTGCWVCKKKKAVKTIDLYPAYHFEVVQLGQWGLRS